MTIHAGSIAREVRFPLGGIGTGCISLAGNGHLTDVEIFNHPDKGYHHGYTHFAVKAERNGALVDARVLQGDWQGNACGQWQIHDRLRKRHTGYGVGPDGETLAGMPHFASCEFDGEFPMAQVSFGDPAFPGNVTMLAFNPFIPCDEDNSSLPLAWFELAVENTTDAALDYTLCLSLCNGLAPDSTVNRHDIREGRHVVTLEQSHYPPDDPRYAELAMTTDAQDVSWQTYGYRGDWFDSLTMFWRDFCGYTRLPEREYAQSQPRFADHASLAAHLHLAAGERGRVRFWLGWYCPVTYNYWTRWRDRSTQELVRYEDYQGQKTWRNHYATRFTDVNAVLDYTVNHAEFLFGRTQAFHDALHDSSLPESVRDAVSANLSVLKSSTCLRLEDGSLWGWEGVLEDIGCCEGSCTHVWHYALALPWLFPRLSRSMRDLNQQYNLRPSGSLRFRLRLPPGDDPFEFRACADGQFGEVLAIYRDWLLCGDRVWLEEKWPAVRDMLRFAWSEHNPDQWDPEQRGVLTGRQHHTLDMELFGPNPWLTGLYIAALEAGCAMANHLGHRDDAMLWHNIARRGRVTLRERLFNGEYFQQVIDLADRETLAAWRTSEESADYGLSGDVWQQYWCKENHQLKYQFGSGCHIDQLMGQWFTWLYSLPPVFDTDQAQQALHALWQHNFVHARHHTNPCRLYGINDEQGVCICSWPAGDIPAIPVPYAQEMMSGFEYQLAALMVASGMTTEGEAITRAIRGRYRGDNRNPWNEMECGSHYARSMASYGLLLAYSGVHYSADTRSLSFHPALALAYHHYFWSAEGAWGTVSASTYTCTLSIHHGTLRLEWFGWPFTGLVWRITLNGEALKAEEDRRHMLHFPQGITLNEGDCLRILLQDTRLTNTEEETECLTHP